MMDEYSKGFETGYAQALMDLFDDECMNPIVVQAREWMDKKAHLADR